MPGRRLQPRTLYDSDGYPSDDSLLRRLMSTGPTAARNLAKKILERRIYRPLFIIDEETCRRGRKPMMLHKGPLVAQFRPKPSETDQEPEEREKASREADTWRHLLGLERRLGAALCPKDDDIDDHHPFIVFCMDERVAYKDPRVLVEVPGHPGGKKPRESGPDSAFLSVPDTKGVLQLLRDFTSDHGVQSQITSMLTNYNTLWKLYVFADWKLVEEHKNNVPAVYAQLVSEVGIEYPVSGMWRDLDRDRINEARLRAAVKEAKKRSVSRASEPRDLMEFLTHPTITGETKGTWRRRLRGLGIISPGEYDRVWRELQPRFAARAPGWDWSAGVVSRNQRDEWKAWILEQLGELAGPAK